MNPRTPEGHSREQSERERHALHAEGEPQARPRILITRAEEVLGERWDDYADAVRHAGGEPVAADLDGFPGLASLEPFHGLVITAGPDVDPARYREQRSERVLEVNPSRDDFEEGLLTEATRRGLPVFGICRGLQLINVARGGSLLQHLEAREPHRARRGADGVSIDSGWHEARVTPGTLLEHLASDQDLHVNSRHHQAVTADRLGPGLVASALAPDGVVEALEDPAHPWFLAVQWHPERTEMLDDPALRSASRALFDAFVAACARVAAR